MRGFPDKKVSNYGKTSSIKRRILKANEIKEEFLGTYNFLFEHLSKCSALSYRDVYLFPSQGIAILIDCIVRIPSFDEIQ